MKLTDEQALAVEHFRTSQSLKISAFAGTGKTSTLTALSRSTSKRGLYLAFNKSIADEAKAKFPQSVDSRTTHSLALRSIPGIFRENNGKLMGKLQGNHVARLLDIEEIAVGGVTLKPRSLGYLTAKTIQRFCQSGDEEVLLQHVPLSGKLERIDPKYQEQFKSYLSELAAHLWARMSDPRDDAPLGHDGYLKLWSLSQPQLNYDYLLLDEAQDTNEAVLSVLRRQNSHLTLVGDRHQQIYEWRGATNAMASIDTESEAILTRSFRFGESVANAATSILRILGESRSVIGDPNRKSTISAFGSTRAILCRTNAGVVSTIVDSLSEGRRPHVVGGVLELIRLLEDVSRLKRNTPAECEDFFGFKDWDEVVEFSQSDEGESLRTFVGIVSAFGEASLIQRLKSVESNEAAADLVISTGHKSKGREWESVTLASDFEPRISKQPPYKPVLNQEEARLLYVATTRAKQLLVVPPLLATKWNVKDSPVSRSAQIQSLLSAAQSQTIPTQTKNPPPKLPSFAKVATPQQANNKSTTVPPASIQESQHRTMSLPALSINKDSRLDKTPGSLSTSVPTTSKTPAPAGIVETIFRFLFK